MHLISLFSHLLHPFFSSVEKLGHNAKVYQIEKGPKNSMLRSGVMNNTGVYTKITYLLDLSLRIPDLDRQFLLPLLLGRWNCSWISPRSAFSLWCKSPIWKHLTVILADNSALRKTVQLYKIVPLVKSFNNPSQSRWLYTDLYYKF